MKNLTQRWTQSGPFLPNLGHFFRFSKKSTGGLPPLSPPLVARLPCLLKPKFLLLTLTRQTLSMFNVCMKTFNYVFLTEFSVCMKTFNYVFLTEFSYTLFTKMLLLFRISLLKRSIYRMNEQHVFFYKIYNISFYKMLYINRICIRAGDTGGGRGTMAPHFFA